MLTFVLCCLVALVSVSSSFSTIVDRLSAYLLPLAIYPVSSASILFSEKSRIQPIFIDLVLVAISWAITISWISLSPYAYAWLPYKNILF